MYAAALVRREAASARDEAKKKFQEYTAKLDKATGEIEQIGAMIESQGKAEKTVEAYARAVRRSADFFDRCPDDLTAEELQTYFAATVSGSISQAML